MGAHLSVEAFFGGVLIGAIVAGSVAGLVAYWRWGKERTAATVQLQVAQANEAATLIAAEQDHAEYERELAATRTAAAQDHAKYESELAATRTAAAQDHAEYERELSTARRGSVTRARGQIASALRSIALQTVAWLERWIDHHQPSAPVD